MFKYDLEDFVWQTTGKPYIQTPLYEILHGKLFGRVLLNEGTWLGGGALRRTVLGQPLDSDFDIFFKGQGYLDIAANLIESHGDSRDVRPHNTTFVTNGLKVQLIHKVWESPEKVIDDFDYTNCQLITDGKDIWVGPWTLYDLGRKRLRVHKIGNVQASLRRLIKYTKQGFYACDGTLLTILDAAKTATLSGPFYID
jgi:hypothetical protein